MAKINKKFYITTSIPYVNADPHVGFAMEIIQTDVLARYHHKNGDETFFLTGTDEHGVKIVRAAEAAGKSPKEFVDEISEKFKALKEALNLSWDDFIRTSDQKRHWPGAQKLWQELERAGDIYKKNYKGLYCVGHEAFVTEKDLVPTPKGRDSDQSVEVDYVCAIHKTKPEIIEEENYFFRLSKYSKEIESKIKDNELRIIPETRKNEILSLLKEGLEDISFSRPSKNLSWGVPVPDDPDHTMYVWCDALSNYISALGYGGEDESKFKKYWPADVHVIGKDILRFHAAIWPGMLIAAGLPLPKAIFVHGFISVGGEKMSKTIGNVIDPFEVVKKYGADALRYYLLREIPSGGDGDFTYGKFEERYNSDLAKGIGNLVARILALAEKSDISVQSGLFDEIIKDADKNIEEFINEFKFNEAIAAAWQLVSVGDKYIDDKKPWALDSSSPDYKKIVGSLLFLISEIGQLIEPFLPETSEKIADLIKNKKSGVLFPRLK